MRNFSFYILLLFLSVNSFSQSPWIPGVNDGFLQFSYTGLYYDQVRYNKKLINSGRNTIDQTYQAYLDFGLLPKIGITLAFPFKVYQVDSPLTGQHSGIGNTSVSIKYSLSNRNTSSAVGLTYDIRSQNVDKQLGLRTGFDANTITPYYTIGSGTKKTYFYANFGYGIRTNKYSDFLRISGEFGFKVFRSAYIAGLLDIIKPVQNQSRFFEIDYPIFITSSSFLDRQSYTGAGIKFLFDFVPDRYGVALSTIGSIEADNTPFSRSYNFGLYRKF